MWIPHRHHPNRVCDLPSELATGVNVLLKKSTLTLSLLVGKIYILSFTFLRALKFSKYSLGFKQEEWAPCPTSPDRDCLILLHLLSPCGISSPYELYERVFLWVLAAAWYFLLSACNSATCS